MTRLTAAFAALIVYAVPAAAQTSNVHTCEDYIPGLKTSARTHDSLAVDAYAELAKRIYETAVAGIIGHAVEPLPPPQSGGSAALRGMAVVGTCQADMSFTYAAAGP